MKNFVLYIGRNAAMFIFFIGLISLVDTPIYAQDPITTLTTISSRLETMAGMHAPEEIYIQTSKDIYETSEDLWFKGFVVNAQYLTPSENAKTLYVCLLQLPERKSVWEEKYAVANGFTDGHIYIQDSLTPGEYVLVAETPLNLNGEGETIKSARKIQIIKNIAELNLTDKTNTVEYVKPVNIAFSIMPEGGHLICGVRNKIAFKSIDVSGKPVEVKGKLYEGNKVISEIRSSYFGMGSFYIMPTATNTYFIKLDGYAETFSLPRTELKGQSLQLLYNRNDTLVLKAAQRGGEQPQKMYLRLQIRGVVYNTAQFVLNQEKLIKILLDQLPAGIAEVTLFNGEFKPVCERLVFINEKKNISIATELNKTSFLVKDKVRLKVRATDEKGHALVSHLGVSVFDIAYDNPQNSETIESHYHLSAQIKGKIFDPGYYFDIKNADRLEALDLLLMTQGWRSYNWSEENLENNLSKRSNPFSDTIVASIFAQRPKSNNILGQQFVMAYQGNTESKKSLLEVNSMGQYKIYPEILQYPQRGYVYFKLMHDKTELRIRPIADVASGRFNEILTERNITYTIHGNQKKKPIAEERIKIAKNVMELEEVTITAIVKKKRIFRDKYMGSLDSLAKLEVSDYVCKDRILNCPIPGHRWTALKPIEGEIYYDPQDLVNHGSHWQMVSTKMLPPYKFPHYTEEQLLEKFNIATIKGYYPHKEFYSPSYDEIKEGYDDFRNTLYWKPDLLTDNNGEAEIEFYTSDINSKFRVVIEGISGNGLLGGRIIEFDVEKRE